MAKMNNRGKTNSNGKKKAPQKRAATKLGERGRVPKMTNPPPPPPKKKSKGDKK